MTTSKPLRASRLESMSRFISLSSTSKILDMGAVSLRADSKSGFGPREVAPFGSGGAGGGGVGPGSDPVGHPPADLDE